MMKEFGSIPEDVKSATLSLRVRSKGIFDLLPQP